MIYLCSWHLILICSSINIIFSLKLFTHLYLASPFYCLSKKIHKIIHIHSQHSFPRSKKISISLFMQKLSPLCSSSLFLNLFQHTIGSQSLLSQNTDNKVQTTPWFNNTCLFLIQILYVMHHQIIFALFTLTSQ